MKPILPLLLATLMAAAGVGAPRPALAVFPPPHVSAQPCGPLAQARGAGNVWNAYFYGERETILDRREAYWLTACFAKESDCKAWLFWIQGDFPLRNMVRRCQKGLE